MTTQPHIEISLESDPAYAQLVAKRDEIVAEQSNIEKAIKDLRHKVASSKIPLSTLKRGVRVAEILGDPTPEAVVDISKIAPMQHRLEDLRVALNELNRRISSARHRASVGVCERVKGHHAALVGDLARALIAAHHANAQYRRFADQLNDADIIWTSQIPPMHPRSIKLDDDLSRNNTIAAWLREAVSHGYIEASTVPEVLGGPPQSSGFFSKGKAVKK